MTDDRPPQPQKVTAPKRADRKPKSARKKSLKQPLADLFTNVGTGVAFVNEIDGVAIINGADQLAEALNKVAKDNGTVYKNLERLVTGSAWGGVIMAAGAILLPIAANHNLLPFQYDTANIDSTPEPVPDISHNVAGH